MVRITFIAPDGRPHAVEASPGITLMRAAKDHDIPGITADCGGLCLCGTCHVHIAEAWRTATGDHTDIETATLEFASDVCPASRLACQITITPALDGLTVHVPES